MVPCADGPPVIESKTLATGSVTSWVTRSIGPKIFAPRLRTGEAPPSLKSRVISVIAMITSTPRTRRVRRLSCTAAPRPPAATRGRVVTGHYRLAPLLSPGVGHQYLTQGIEVLDALAGAEHHGVERVVGDLHGHPGLLPDSCL